MPAKVIYYAHNRCPECGAMDKPQVLGRYECITRRWFQHRTCSECGKTYLYDVHSLYGAQLDRIERKPKRDQAASLPREGR